jgi:hypothetical protein
MLLLQRPSRYLCGLLLLSASSAVQGSFFFKSKRDDSFSVLSPRKGDTLVAGGDFEITWKSTGSAERNVTILLRQGPAENVTLQHVISGLWPWGSSLCVD